MVFRGLLSIVAVAMISADSVQAAALEKLTLMTYRGQDWTISDVDNSPLVVVAFLGTECPLAKLYGPRLQELHSKFADRGVAFVGVNSNKQDSVTEIGSYVSKAGITFTMLKDVGNKAADQLGAERTPEVFLLDQERNVRYRGRIDDQYQVGIARDKVRRQDLAIAIQELLDGQDVSVKKTESPGCHIGRVKDLKPHGDITFNNQIVRIFNKRCLECHRSGEIAPFELATYEDVLGWEDTILEVIDDSRMPPWFANPQHGTFSNDSRLTADEKRLIHTWVNNGMPEGDAADLPQPPNFVEGWRIEQPDEEIRVRDTPYDVPAEGVVDYQYFMHDPEWTEDRYVVAAEARPDNVAVVHHIIAYVIRPGGDPQKGRDREMLVGYAPGAIPQVLKDGTAIHVKAGSKLLFEMHYTPNGTPQKDLSYIGLKYTEKKNVKRILQGKAIATNDFDIPPRDPGFLVTEESRPFSRDYLLRDMTPHMHLRGKSFRYIAKYPDGKSEILLDVPNYDFNWQLTYRLSEPKLLKKGTILRCEAVYDNSADNPANPDPSATVGWGDQSFNEMMIGFLTAVEPDKR